MAETAGPAHNPLTRVSSAPWRARILTWYLFTELATPFLWGVFLFSAVLMIRAIDDLIPFVRAGADLGLVLTAVLAFLPMTFSMSAPMAVLLSTLNTYGRLSDELELNAMRAGGVSYRAILTPALLLGIGVGLTLFYWNDQVGPRGLEIVDSLKGELIRQMTRISLEPENFNSRLSSEVAFYFRSYGESGQLRDVSLIRYEPPTSSRQQSDIIIISSPQAELLPRFNEGKISINLAEGSLIHAASEAAARIQFETMEFVFDVSDIIAKLSSYRLRRMALSNAGLLTEARRLHERARGFTAEMEQMRPAIEHLEQKPDRTTEEAVDLDRLKSRHDQLRSFSRGEYENTQKFVHEYQQRLCFPVAVFILPAIGAPLGILTTRGKKILSLIATLGVVFAYYLVLELCSNFAQGMAASRHIIDPGYAIWIPCILLVPVAVVLNWVMARR